MIKLVALLVLLAASPAWGDTHPCTVDCGTTCSSSSVASAISAASDGDTVTVPAGTCTWTSTVTINDKLLTIQGAGIGSTIITLGADNTPLFAYASTHSKGGEITGFTFENAATYFSDKTTGLIRFGGGVGWRFHDNKIILRGPNTTGDASTSIGLTVWYQSDSTRKAASGLIDNNTFETVSGGNCSHAFIFHNNYLENGAAAIWGWPTQIATGNNTLFVEDNTFTHGSTTCGGHQMHTFTSHAGTIFVFRHNTVTNGQLDMHGYCGTDGTKEYQVTDNVFTNNIDGLYRWINVRGGTGYIANNQINGNNPSYPLDLTEYRLGGLTSCVNDSLHRTVRGIDVNPPNTCCENKEGFPCIGSIGYGQVVAGEMTYDPLYIYNNTNDGDAVVPRVYDHSATCDYDPSDIIDAGDEYILTAKPSFTEYTYPHPLQGTSEPASTLGTGGYITDN